MTAPTSVLVVEPGPFATVQDRGRPGFAALGVTGSGAADRRSLALANRLVGNLPPAAAIEVTFGGLAVTFDAPALVALTGAPCPAATVNGRPIGMYGPVDVPAGASLRLGAPDRGVRTYLAVRGGVDVPMVLGSRSRDVLSGIGPPPLAAGMVLLIGRDTTRPPVVDLAPQAPYPDVPVLRVLPGPREDWFTADSLTALWDGTYEVTADCDRVGVRLLGPALRRRAAGELPSEGMVAGSVQIPPDGQPVIFLADHPVTGGYPVVAVVLPDDLPLAAQSRPGQQVRLRRYRPGGSRGPATQAGQRVLWRRWRPNVPARSPGAPSPGEVVPPGR